MAEPAPDDFWRHPIQALQAAVDSTSAGLGDAEALQRLGAFGANLVRPHVERALLIQFVACFRNPLVLVLLAASAIAGAVGDIKSFVVISGIVMMSVTLDFWQDYRAGRAVDRLRRSVALRATVVREGRARAIPVAELVPGDVVLLAAGDLVPADGRLLEARDLFVNQALLTGEPYPVEKHAIEALPEAELVGATNAAFMGTSVISGAGRMLVARTGAATALGQIAGSLAQRPPPTAFERGTQAFGALIMRLTVVLVLAVLLINALFHRPLLDSFLFAVALAVGLTPELLPMVVSVTLSRGAMRLARRQVIVKRLSAVQELGGIDVLCTDKTGTLTEGRIRLERHLDALGHDSDRVLELAYLNSHFESGIRSPLDDAILAHMHIDVSAWRKVDEVPFDFERRRVSVLLANADRHVLVAKGSVEDVLRLCAFYETDGGRQPLDDDIRGRIASLFADLSGDGFRVLGIAWREAPVQQTHAVINDECELVFSGCAAFLDPPKISAGTTLAALAADGVSVKIITGDHELVARHVASQLGFAVSGALNGADIQNLDDAALRVRAEQANLFCRVTPQQKTRILNALRGAGHQVGFLGDGINDAPALHAANVGISVDTAVDVAKEAADLVLLEHDLSILHDGVREGRRTFGNVIKYIMMGTSSNFGNMFSMAGGTLFLPFLPLLPIQILLNNFLYDLPEIAIPLDEVDDETLARPSVWDMEFIRRFMLTLGPISSLFDLLTFYLLLAVFEAGEVLFHTGWFIESVTTQVLVIFIIRTRGSPLASRPNTWLVVLSLAVVAAANALPWLPFAAHLGFVPLPPALFGALTCVVILYLVSMYVARQWFFRHWRDRTGQPR